MHFKTLLKVSCFILLCLFVKPALAQNVTISGKVTDAKDGSAIPGVSVVIKGTATGTVTDVNGNFKLSAKSASGTLVVSFVGYDRQELPISSAPMKISLSSNTTALNEVAVVSIGYGTAKKKDVTGAVEQLTAKNFNQGAVINPVDQLAGKVAGLTITQPGGDPNQTASVRLRGQSSLAGGLSPLFVVDGIILDDPNQFQNIPPDDIASYDVLKDASASAIYGSRGANGVIIVTTKKGTAGKAQITYDGLVGSAVQSKYYDLLDASEYRAAISNISGVNVSTYDKGANTDWQKAITRTALQQRHSVSIMGGTNNFNYAGSVNYQDQQGIVITSDKKQLGLRFNGELKALDNKLDVKMGIQNVSTNRSYILYDNFSYMYNAPPTYPIKNANGSYNEFSDFNLENPVEHINEQSLKGYEYLTLINSSFDYSIIDGLKIGAQGAISRNNVQGQGFYPTFADQGNLNQAEQANENTNSYKANIHLTYDKTWGKHSLSFFGGYEYNDYLYSNFTAFGEDYITPDQLSNNLGSGVQTYNQIASNKTEYELESYIARANYNFDNRFYVTGTIRIDKSSKFGSEFQTGDFPSFDVAYRFKKDFLSNVSWIDDIKLRVGYGVTGNSDAISPYSSLGTVGTGAKFYDGSSGQYLSSYLPNQNPNPALKWEEKHGRNIGLDFSLFNNRLSGNVNYFNDITKNLLYNYTVPTPPFSINTILANVGQLTNKGVELALNYEAVKGSKFSWNIGGQISTVKTTVNSLSGTFSYNGQNYALNSSQIPTGYAVGRGLSSNPITFLKPGYSPYVFYLPHYTGLDASGNQTFDGKTIAQDATPAGHYIDPAPKFNYGVSNTFNYGAWSLNFAIRGVYGQKTFNNTALDIATITRLPGANVTKEALTNGIKDSPVASDLWLESSSFLRLDNATLSYAFSGISFASSFRIYASTNNLFVITKYKGLDPEVKTENASGGNILFGSNISGSANQAYIDANYGGQAYYPRVRSFTFGVNISLK